MDVTTNSDTSSEFNKSIISSKTSSDVDTIGNTESPGEIIKRFELEIAYISEKLSNLNLLSMRVETKENEFEALLSDMDPVLVANALEIDLLSGLLDSEVKVLEKQISDLQIEKANVKKFLDSHMKEGGPFMRMEDMLDESERTLEQSLEQVLEIKIRSANFQKNLLRFSGENVNTNPSLEDSDLLELQEKMKMQNVEHQRHILRMLEKSWEREMDLEKRVNELSEMKDDLTKKLQLSQQEVVYAQEECEMTLGKFYEANYKSDLLMETSKELLNEIKMLQFNLKGLFLREAELRSGLVKLKEQVKESDVREANEKKSMENTIEELREKINEMKEEIKDANEKVISLEKEVSETNVKLQHVEACYEASQEEKSMLHSTIMDMDNVINDMKKKVLKSQSETEIAEDKCIILSESNSDLKKELSIAKNRVKNLEESLDQMEETKKATAKDISLRTKLITDLVMQMALERERLQKQISSLKQENKSLVKKRVKKTEGGSVKVSNGDKVSSTKSDFTTMVGNENKESLSTSLKEEEARNETVTGPTVSASEPYIARNIDAWQLKGKQYLVLIIVIIVFVYCGLHQRTQVVNSN